MKELAGCCVGDFMRTNVIGVPIAAVRAIGDQKMWLQFGKKFFQLLHCTVTRVNKRTRMLICRITNHTGIPPAASATQMNATHAQNLQRGVKLMDPKPAKLIRITVD